MTKKNVDKTPIKRAAWLERSRQILGTAEEETIRLLSRPRVQSIRLNPLIAPPAATLHGLEQLGWRGTPYAWTANCYTSETGLEIIRDSKLAAAGAVYIQNAASWLPVLALKPQPSESILDVCAAPGGKASHIATFTDNQAELTVNDNSRVRLARMRANLDRLGVEAEYTLFEASRLSSKLPGRQFDKILLDAPCSGDGLMQYTRDKDFTTWSVAQVQRLSSLQKQILLQAWQLLKPGGTLVYSTCTMAPEENEVVIDYLLRKRTDAQLVPFSVPVPNRMPALQGWNNKAFTSDLGGCLRLAPSSQVEAFFVAKLHKLAEAPEMVYSHSQ
ncbi:MAG TPA: RsmB/NOP family class I SAM-dependent RNA methyltransferase [Candidatus Saccharimonadales bacterium]|nr:RsmB/NOP family class I SAM-dependent RNA methyltransferase [Candidatus Saccharimonadales bacterium]